MCGEDGGVGRGKGGGRRVIGQQGECSQRGRGCGDGRWALMPLVALLPGKGGRGGGGLDAWEKRCMKTSTDARQRCCTLSLSAPLPPPSTVYTHSPNQPPRSVLFILTHPPTLLTPPSPVYNHSITYPTLPDNPRDPPTHTPTHPQLQGAAQCTTGGVHGQPLGQIALEFSGMVVLILIRWSDGAGVDMVSWWCGIDRVFWWCWF